MKEDNEGSACVLPSLGIQIGFKHKKETISLLNTLWTVYLKLSDSHMAGII